MIGGDAVGTHAVGMPCGTFTPPPPPPPPSGFMTTSSLKFTYLRALGYTGALPEMELAWLQANGATSSHISDAWREFLVSALTGLAATQYIGHITSMKFYYFGLLGHTGAVADRERKYWQAAVDSLP